MRLSGRRESSNVDDRRGMSGCGGATSLSKWLKRGLTSGDITLGDTFSPAYSDL